MTSVSDGENNPGRVRDYATQYYARSSKQEIEDSRKTLIR
jgi:hypothetical protein